jgi:quinoprotein glucose dehydrogenase
MRAMGDFLSFRVAGGHDPARLRVELRAGGAVVASWTGANVDAFLEVIYPLAALRGQMFTMALVDEATGGWGHIMLDEVRQWSWRDAPPKPCPKP